QDAPASTDFCQRTCGGGLPAAPTVKEAVAPDITVCGEGCRRILGAVCTLSTATEEDTAPTMFDATARYREPVHSAGVAEIDNVALDVPLYGGTSVSSCQDAPPSVERCQRNAGAGSPLASHENRARPPDTTV